MCMTRCYEFKTSFLEWNALEKHLFENCVHGEGKNGLTVRTLGKHEQFTETRFLNTFTMYICIKLCKQLASEQSISSVLTNALAATDFLVANTNSLCLFMHNSKCQHLNKNSGIPCHAFYLGSSQTTIYTQQLMLITANWWNAPKMQFIENIRSNMCQMMSFFSISVI